MNVETIKEKMCSRKFIFSMASFLSISILLFFEKLPPVNYESIGISIILTYLGSNVAHKYVNGKFKTEESVGESSVGEDVEKRSK